MSVLSDHRRRRLDEAVRVARAAVKVLEEGARAGEPDDLAMAGRALQDVGKLASRYAAELGDVARAEPARGLKPVGGRRGPA